MKSISADIPIHDIAPILEIREYSMYWFMLLITVVFAIAFVVAKQIRKKKKPKEVDVRSERYEHFARIDMSDSKAAAYAICKQGSFFAHDSLEHYSVYQTLFKQLESYKYTRNTEPIDEEALTLYRSYQAMITV